MRLPIMRIYIFLAGIVAITALLTACKKASPPFTFFIHASQTRIALGQGIQFYDSTFDAKSILWNFGDGTTSSFHNPVHTYAVAGSYTVTFEASNSVGHTNLSTISVLVLNVGSWTFKGIKYYPLQGISNSGESIICDDFMTDTSAQLALAFYDTVPKINGNYHIASIAPRGPDSVYVDIEFSAYNYHLNYNSKTSNPNAIIKVIQNNGMVHYVGSSIMLYNVTNHADSSSINIDIVN